MNYDQPRQITQPNSVGIPAAKPGPSRAERNVFVELLHKKYGGLIIMLLREKGVHSGADCEDARQDFYLYLLDEKHHYAIPEDSRVKDWLRTACGRVAKDYRNKKKREPKLVYLEELLSAGDTESAVSTPNELDKQSMRTWMNEILSNAPGRISSGLELAKTFFVSSDHKVTAYMLIAHLAAGLDETEIGFAYGVTKQAVNKWLKKWYQFAKTELGSQYTE